MRLVVVGVVVRVGGCFVRVFCLALGVLVYCGVSGFWGSGLVDFLQVGAVQILVAFELLRSGSWVNLVFGVLNRFLLVCVVVGFWLCLVLSFGCFGDLLCWWFVVWGFWFPGF